MTVGFLANNFSIAWKMQVFKLKSFSPNFTDIYLIASYKNINKKKCAIECMRNVQCLSLLFTSERDCLLYEKIALPNDLIHSPNSDVMNKMNNFSRKVHESCDIDNLCQINFGLKCYAEILKCECDDYINK